MDKDLKIYVAGHNGMVGSAICRKLENLGYSNIITKNRDRLDLTCQHSVNSFLSSNKIDQIYLAAARVGGIQANNNFPANFLFENLMIQNNIIYGAWKAKIKKLLFLGSSCIYPRMADQPITEDALLTGKLEPTNEPYAIAKIAGIKLCESFNRQYKDESDFRCVMPTNLYGKGDNYNLDNSHVIPALIRKFYEAKINNHEAVSVWGTGNVFREFLHVDDMADACVYLMNIDKKAYDNITDPMCSHINVGSSKDISIKDLANLIAKITGFKGKIIFDTSKPDGTPKKLMDSKKLLKLGWASKIDLEQGLTMVLKDFINNYANIRE